MKKRFAIRVLSLVICMLMLIGTVGCNITSNPTDTSTETPSDETHDHTHEHTDENECTHNWVDATCTKPKTCSLCGETEGEAKGHTGGTATCLAKAVCEACKEEYGEVTAHNYDQNAWGYTSPDGHARLCTTTGCQAHETIVAHKPNVPATEKDPSVCTECEYVIAPALGHITHTAKPEWKKDDSGHWHDCVGCSTEKVDFAAHVYDGDCDTSCDVCGYERNVTHNYSVEKADKLYIASEADCENAATYYKSCACGAKGTETFASGDKLGHSWGDWTSAHGTHTRVCERDDSHTESGTCSGGTATCEGAPVCSVCNNEYGTPTDHDFGEWEVTVPATCTKTGTKRQSCKNDGCQAYNEDTIAATGHSYTSSVTEPTCSEQGYTTYTCGVDGCGETYKDSYTEATGQHRWDIPAQTCTQGQQCLDCDETTDPLGHDYDESGSVAATCTTAKKITYTCSRCPDSYDEEDGEPLGHDIAGVTATLELVDGETCLYVRHYTCQRADCGEDVEGDEITQHAAYTALIKTEATCVSEGEKEFTCTACNKPVKDNEVIPVDTVTGHKWDSGTPSSGKTVYACQNDGCTATKEVVSVSKNDVVNVTDVKNSELQLEGGANITLGDAADEIGDKNVTISADTVDKDSLGLSTEQLAQVGDNKVYDFSIKEGETPITSFGGKKITVTLPYTLEKGENVDSIAVWFIADDGTLTSIEATYSNGFVTFETDHFSYYTVTELTPAERCALYGHSETVKIVQPTCTADGYKLTFCIRCGHSEKVSLGEALGHDYQIDTEKSTAATCTSSGKTVQTCQNCKKSTSVTVRATGHSWVESEKVDATCQAAGYIEFSCENECGSTKKQVLMQVSHSMTETVVAPTCTDSGYTEYKCTNEGCEYSYKDTFTESLGHEYTYTFEWAGDYSSAVCHIGCERDGCDYSEDAAASIKINDIKPDCDSYGKYEYIATFTHNGKALEDIQYKDYDDKSFKHNYGSDWKSDAENHWNVCKDCGEVDKDSITKHTFDESDYNASGHWNVCSECEFAGAVTKHTFTASDRREPTCVDAGSEKLNCECGYEKTQSIPATGEHSYEGGKCTVCGKEDSACDHKTLTQKVLDISEYGICIESIKVLTCECGELVYIEDEDMLEEGCDWEEIEDTFEHGEDENGNEYQKGTMRCSICGAEMELYATAEKNGCEYNIKYVFILRTDDAIIFDDLRMEYSYDSHGETEKVKVDLSEYSSCGGYVYMRVCKDCGEVEYLGENMQFNCDIPEPTETTVIDENGVEHTIQTATCPDCGLVFKVDIYREVESVCEWIDYMEMSVTCGDEVIYFVVDYEYDDEHEVETTYEMFGNTCDDGYKVIEYCPKCDTKYTWSHEGHYTLHEEIDLSEYGACGGYMSADKCRVCDTITYAYVNMYCGDTSTAREYTDEDGNNHYVEIRTCEECGLVYERDIWRVVVNECLTRENEKTVLTINGTVIVDTVRTYDDVRHDYIYDAVMSGETCDDGITVNMSCSKCDYSNTYTSRGHYYVYESYDLNEFGTCGGYVEIRKCAACGEVEHANSYNNCYLKEIGETSDGFTIRECQQCKAVYHSKRVEGEKDENCSYETYIEEYLYIDSKLVLSYAYTSYSTEHNYRYNVTMIGETCEDGLDISRYCADCSYSEPNRIEYGCYTVYTEYDLSDYGIACGGYVELGECIACGLVRYAYENYNCMFEYVVSEDGNEYGDMMVCANCGTQRKRESVISEKDENCNCIRRSVNTLYVNGDVVFEYAEEWETTEHNYEQRFELLGSNCTDGVLIRDVCKDCGYESDSWTSYYHNTYLVFELDPTEYGFCDYHYVEVHACACGENTHIYYNIDGKHDKNGNISCENCNLSVLEMYDTVEDGCYTTEEKVIAVYNGEEELYYNTSGRTYADHTFSVDATYADGVITADIVCTECGFTSSFAPETVTLEFDEESGEYYYDLHFTPETAGKYVIYSMTDGDTYVELYALIDGEYSYLTYNDDGSDGGNFRLAYYLEAGIEYVYRMKFLKGQEGTISYVLSASSSSNCSHSTNSYYVLPEGAESCEDGLLELSICISCGEVTYIKERNEHARTEIYFDLTQYGFCEHHYIELYSCPCGQEFDFYYGGMSYGDESGFELCDSCDLRILNKYDTVKNGCEITDIREVGIYNGEEEIYYNISTETYAEHTFSVEASVVGGVVNAEVVCTECGLTSSFAPDSVILVYDEERGEYYYDVTYIPEDDGYYYIFVMSEGTTALQIFRVYDGKYEFIGGDYYEEDKPNEDKPVEDKPVEDMPAIDGNLEFKPADDVTIGDTVVLVPSEGTAADGIILNGTVADNNSSDVWVDGNLGEEGAVEDKPVEDKPVEDKPVEDTDKLAEIPVYDTWLESGIEYVFRVSFADRQQSGEIGYIVIPQYRDCSHETDMYYVLPDGADSCEDGLLALRVCRKCGAITYISVEYYHNRNYEYYELSDYEICGVYLEKSSCPCGQEGYLYYNSDCYGEESKEEVTDENGVNHVIVTRTCADCGTVLAEDSYTVREGCVDVSYIQVTMTVNGEVVIDVKGVERRTEYHEYEYNYIFDNPDATPNCEEGVTVEMICTACGDKETNYYRWHYEVTTEYYNLKDAGACYGFIEVRECPCGYYHSVYEDICADDYTSNEQMYDDGIIHYVEARTCSECGLRYQTDRYTVRDDATCIETSYETVTVSVSGVFVCEIKHEETETVHKYVASGQLHEGAASCEDGVTITYQCACGESYTKGNSYSHVLIETERYELTDYGALDIHAGAIVKSVCPCGQKSNVEIDESLCEFDTEWIDCWVEGYVSGYIYTAEYVNGHYIYCDAYQYTCAVTGPDCNCSYRYAIYYMPVEGECKAEQWKVFQIGYNPEDGTYLAEIKVKTGNVVTYHTYESLDMHEEYENGNSKVEGTRRVCPDCGSYCYSAYYYYENGHQSGYETKYENTLDDGNRKLYCERVEYDINGERTLERYTYIDADGVETWNQTEWENIEQDAYDYNGMLCTYKAYKTTFTDSKGRNEIELSETITTKEYIFQGIACYYELSRTTSADGYVNEYSYVEYKGYCYEIHSYHGRADEYWERYDYTYELTESCTRTDTYTNSDGEKNVEGPYEWHQAHSYIIVQHPTCTQDGLECYQCVICGTVSEEYPMSPYEHSWDWVDGIAYCTRCGMENANGADGDIVIEDLTDAYGNGENYVAGYWQKNEVDFVWNVSIMLHTPLDNGNDQILLENIMVTELEAVRALSFSKADVLAAVEAKAAELGITLTPDMYDVRLAFVPLGADESHDYAITFTEDEEQDFVVSESDAVKVKLANGEMQTITITSDVDTYCEFYSNSDNAYNLGYTLLDANGEIIDEGTLYWVGSVNILAGETYTLEVYHNGKNEEIQIAYISIMMY